MSSLETLRVSPLVVEAFSLAEALTKDIQSYRVPEQSYLEKRFEQRVAESQLLLSLTVRLSSASYLGTSIEAATYSVSESDRSVEGRVTFLKGDFRRFRKLTRDPFTEYIFDHFRPYAN